MAMEDPERLRGWAVAASHVTGRGPALRPGSDDSAVAAAGFDSTIAAEMKVSPSWSAGGATEAALEGTGISAVRRRPAASESGVAGPPYGHPLQRVTSTRRPSLRASDWA